MNKLENSKDCVLLPLVETFDNGNENIIMFSDACDIFPHIAAHYFRTFHCYVILQPLCMK